MNGSAKLTGLLLSGYDADSHAYWRKQVIGITDAIDWHQLSLEPRHFTWRVAGAPLSWRKEVAFDRNYDVVLATSVVDINRLIGLHPALSDACVVLYFHDNQFVYPTQAGQQGIVEIQLACVYSALTASRLLFNSDYNRQTFLEGAGQLLAKLPDDLSGIVPTLAAKSSVLPVPVQVPATALQPTDSSLKSDSTLKVVWNHRWEYDKGPDRLLAIVELLEQRQVDYELTLLGRQFRQVPDALQQICSDYEHRLAHVGYVPDRVAYFHHLNINDVVLSTALHEFQGLAVQEAVMAGCTPVLPARLVYPEWAQTQFLYDSNPANPDAEAQAAVQQLMKLAELKRTHSQLPGLCLDHYLKDSLADDYRRALQSSDN